jgi:hypothetical protein
MSEKDKKSRREIAEERAIEKLGELKTPVPEVYVVKVKTSKALLAIYIPILLITVFLTIMFVSWSFGWVSFESYQPQELTEKLGNPRADVRRMAAVDWAGQLIEKSTRYESHKNESDLKNFESLRPSRIQSERVAALLLAISPDSNEAVANDPKWGAALTVILSFCLDQQFARSKFIELLSKEELASQSELQFYAMLALARVGLSDSQLRTEQKEQLLKIFDFRAQTADNSTKKAVAFALGRFEGSPEWQAESIKRLLTLVGDADSDVGLNAALSLHRLGRSEGSSVIEGALSEVDAIDSNKITMSQLERALTIIGSIGNSQVDSYARYIKKWADSHPNFKIRDACKKIKY